MAAAKWLTKISQGDFVPRLRGAAPTQPLPGEPVTLAQRQMIWDLVSERGVSKNSFSDHIYRYFRVRGPRLLNKTSAATLIDDLAVWPDCYCGSSTAWMGPRPADEEERHG